MIKHDRLTSWLLRQVLPEEDVEFVVGDLLEERALRSRKASAVGTLCWYWHQVLRSLVFLGSSRVRFGAWFFTIGIAVLAYLTIGALEIAAGGAASLWVPRGTTLRIVVDMVIGLVSVVVVSYCAALVRKTATYVLALFIAVAIAMVIFSAKADISQWFLYAALILGPLAAVLGGMAAPDRKPKR